MVMSIGLDLTLGHFDLVETVHLPGAPVNTVLPEIIVTGILGVGSHLYCVPGVWGGEFPITYQYQWHRNPGAAAIAGATRQDYFVSEDDIGSILFCAVTATNPQGFAAENSLETIEVPDNTPSISIITPAALNLDNDEQPIGLYDYKANNLVNSPEDFTDAAQWNTNTSVSVTINTIEDVGAGNNRLSLINSPPIIAGRQYGWHFRLVKDGISSATGRFACVNFSTGGGNVFALFDTSAADINHGVLTDYNSWDNVRILDGGTYWDIEMMFKATAGGAFSILSYYPSFGQNVADLSGQTFSSAYNGDAIGTIGILRTQFRDYSSPQVYVGTTPLVASFGGINFVDTDDVGGQYRMETLLPTGEIMQYNPAALANVDVVGGLNASNQMVVEGTLAGINGLFLPVAPIPNFFIGNSNLNIKCKRLSDNIEVVTNIPVTVTA